MADEIKVVFGADTKGLDEGLKKAEAEIKNTTDAIANGGTAMGTAFKAAFAAIGAALSVDMFAKAIQGSIDFADNLRDMSIKSGASVEVLAGFKLAADNAGSSLEGVGTGLKFLSKHIADSDQMLAKLGITAKDPTEAMIQLADVFAGIDAPSQKAALAMQLFGRSGLDLLPMLSEGSDALREQIRQGTELSHVTSDMADQSDAFNDKIGVMKAQLSGNVNMMAGQLLPTLNNLADAFKTDTGGADAFRIAADTLGFALKSLASIGLVLRDIFMGAGDAIGGYAAAAAMAAQGEFAKAGQILDDLDAKHQARAENLKATMKTLWSDAPEKEEASSAKTGVRSKTDLSGILGGGAAGKADTSEADKAAKAEEDARKLAQRLNLLAVEFERTKNDSIFAQEEELITRRRALGEIDAKQEIEARRALKDKQFELELKAAQDIAELHRGDVLAYQQDLLKIEQIKAKHDADSLKLETQAAAQHKAARDKQMAEEAARIKGFMQPMTAAIDSAFQGVIQGTQTLQQALANIWQSIGLMIAQTLAKMLADTVATNIATSISGKAKAAGEISTSAGVAGAKAAESQAAIPVVGPSLAAAAFASVSSMVMGAMSFLTTPSAAGGFDIPAGINPLTQLHEKEMVLPAKHADVIRSLADNGTAARNASPATNITIQAMDAQSVKRLFTQNGSALVAALNNQRRGFAA